MRFGITSKMALIASTLVFCMCAITGLVFHIKADRFLTERGLDYLRTDTYRVGHTLNSNIRQQRTDAWSLTQKDLQKKKKVALELLAELKEGKPGVEKVRELDEKIQELLKKHPQYLQVCYVHWQEEGVKAIYCAKRERSLEREAGMVPHPQAATDPFGLPPGRDWTRPVAAAVGKLSPAGAGPEKPVLHVGAIVQDKEGDSECGVIVVSMDLSAGLNDDPKAL